MDNEEINKENTSTSPIEDSDNNIDNEDIEVIPYPGPVICDSVAVTYGPDPTVNEYVSSIEDYDIVIPCIDDEIMIDVNSDMYGGPVPEYLLLEETDLSDFSSYIKSSSDYNAELDDESNDRKSNIDDDLDYYG